MKFTGGKRENAVVGIESSLERAWIIGSLRFVLTKRSRPTKKDVHRYMLIRARMIRALLALAVTMSVCAAFLSWIQPRWLSHAADVHSALLLQSLDHSVASDRGGLTQWQRIELIGYDSHATGLWSIQDDISSSEFHFLVTLSGKLLIDQTWRIQSPIGDTDALVIAIESYSRDTSMPMLQWRVLDRLLSAIDGLYEQDGRFSPELSDHAASSQSSHL
jgi:hypothetical protein